ncbi:MAG TPA: ureidoglycolate lyase, partial [Chroococcales cyanobacterium]
MPGEDLTAPLTASVIKARKMTREAYQPYGDVIGADDVLPFKPANNGTAKRFNHLCDLKNLKPESARLNVCIFRCSPLPKLPLEIKL